MSEKRNPPVPRRTPRPLISAEDRALWDIAASRTQPVAKMKPRVHGHDAAARGGHRDSPAAEPVQGQVQWSHVRSAAEAAPGKPHPLASGAQRKSGPPPLAKFDAGKERALRSGKSEIEARIDLHGMRQSEAHVVLKRFLYASHAKGLSSVLVITGKGGPEGKPAADAPFWMSGAEGERGVLRRNVPRWLAEPDLRGIVVSFTEAAIRHGGGGALYVHLRRRVRHGD